MPPRARAARNAKRRRTGRSTYVGGQSLAALPSHKIRRTTVITVAQAAGDQGYLWTFRPSDVADWSFLSGTFDMYRVARATLRWVLVRAHAGTNSLENYPVISAATDWNSVTTPAAQATVLDHQNCKTVVFGPNRREMSLVTYPKARTTTGASSVAITDAPQWLATAENNIEHAGVLYWITNYNSTAAATSTIQLYVEVDLEFKLSK